MSISIITLKLYEHRNRTRTRTRDQISWVLPHSITYSIVLGKTWMWEQTHLYSPLGFLWPWPWGTLQGTCLLRPPPCSPTSFQSIRHTGCGRRWGTNGKNRSYASAAACIPLRSYTHTPCSSCQRAACLRRQRWRQWWPAPKSGSPVHPLSYQWFWSACWAWARI